MPSGFVRHTLIVVPTIPCIWAGTDPGRNGAHNAAGVARMVADRREVEEAQVAVEPLVPVAAVALWGR